MIGLLTPVGSLCGFDCAVHMCRSDGLLADPIFADTLPSGGV